MMDVNMGGHRNMQYILVLELFGVGKFTEEKELDRRKTTYHVGFQCTL